MKKSNNNCRFSDSEMDLASASIQDRRQHFEKLRQNVDQVLRRGRSSNTSHRSTIGNFSELEKSFEQERDFDDFNDFEDDEIQSGSVERPSRLDCLVDEVITKEKTYINTLQRGIGGYLKIFAGQVPATLVGRKNTIIGNVITIFDFHSKIFLPELNKCSRDIEKISRLFHKSIMEDSFYIYVHYAMNNWKASRIYEDHREFFTTSQDYINDRLGITSLLVEPIQRIPKYILLFENILKVLGEQVEESPEVKSKLAAASKAWKALEKLAVCVNASVNVKDITDCYEISLPHQGKFRDFQEFDFHHNETSRRFKGHVFLFEKCIVYTENKNSSDQKKDKRDQNKFIYRGYYSFAKLGVFQDVNHGKLSLFRDRLGQKQLDIYGPSPTIKKWYDCITSILITQLKQDKSNDKGRFTWHGITEMSTWWNDTQ